MSYTYTELKTAVKDYTDNQETTFVSHLDTFIRSAEERIFKSVDLEFFRKNVSGAMTSGNEFLATPDDYLASFSLSIVNSSSKEFLLQKMSILCKSITLIHRPRVFQNTTPCMT